MEKKPYLEIAKIINTHGVHGAVKLEPWCDSPETLKKIKTLYLANGTAYETSGFKLLNGGFVVLSLSGVDTVEAAVKLKNKVLSARREDIPLKKGSHFIEDLIGLPVIDLNTGTVYGTLSEVIRPALQEIYVVKTEDGRTVMLPNVPAFVDHADDEAIYITPIGGFFDNDSVEA